MKRKLISGFMTVALLVAVLGYFSVNASQKTLQNHIGKDSVALATAILSYIDRTIYMRIEQIQAFAADMAEQEVFCYIYKSAHIGSEYEK